ncbi:unnamed protein product [Moneuplotes crassus]|uniref:Uncharacterized protein n=1 Tax=Euplotes crassus TaxID=5936 RepID=A0AAD1UEB7_EUPCR|nr:unnamed protein product [Moneuplotes crassus]
MHNRGGRVSKRLGRRYWCVMSGVNLSDYKRVLEIWWSTLKVLISSAQKITNIGVLFEFSSCHLFNCLISLHFICNICSIIITWNKIGFVLIINRNAIFFDRNGTLVCTQRFLLVLCGLLIVLDQSLYFPGDYFLTFNSFLSEFF